MYDNRYINRYYRYRYTPSVGVVTRAIQANTLEKVFGVAVGANEVPEPKPGPGGLLMCCETLGVDPKRSV